MKAIFIKSNFNEKDIKSLNDDLKDCVSIVHHESLEYGTLMIFDNHTRKDKLIEIEKKLREDE